MSQFVLINDLESKISRISDDRVSDLESKVSRLSDDLDNHADKIYSEEKVVQMKVSFADRVLSLQQARLSCFAVPSFSGPSASGPSYASVARSNLSGSVLVAKCADVSVPLLNVQAVEELLDNKNSGLIPLKFGKKQ